MVGFDDFGDGILTGKDVDDERVSRDLPYLGGASLSLARTLGVLSWAVESSLCDSYSTRASRALLRECHPRRNYTNVYVHDILAVQYKFAEQEACYS